MPVATDPHLLLLATQRDAAERLLNAVRGGVLLLLAVAALGYAPTLTPALNRANVIVLLPALAWTLAQYLVFYRRPLLPHWLPVVNPIVDITAVTAIIGGYALASTPALALETPIFLAYFVIIAARPIASSARKAGAVALLAVGEYAVLVTAFVAGGQLPVIMSPVAASAAAGISPLDEGAKLLLLAVGGAVATYASFWQERLATGYSRATHDREQLEARLAEAQLQSLRLQLHPHFLFNTLNTITALVHTDPRAAERMVSGLSELLRLSLHSAAEQEVPLARELEVLGHYIDIQHVRFQDRLTVAFDIDFDARAALVPNLLLQPLVENAIRHGIAPRVAPGRVEVHASREGGMLRLRVADDGVGERAGGSTGGSRREGVGLGNTRARLQSLYPGDFTFAAGTGPGGGFAVDIIIPWRVDSATIGGGGGAALASAAPLPALR